MHHHEEEERLYRPKMQAVEEVADRREVPPLRPESRQDDPGDDKQDEAGQRCHPKEVDVAMHVGRLLVRQKLLVRKVFRQRLLRSARETHCSPLLVPPGNGRTTARTNTTIISAMTMRFATEMWMNPHVK